MKIIRKIIILTAMFLNFEIASSQNEKALCKAVDNMKFRKAEKIVRKVIRINQTGQTNPDSEAGGYTINLSPCFDSITNWLKKRECVDDAFWDKCQAKMAIYPGWSSIGVKFRTKKGIVEKCFLIQEGTTGQVNLLGWRPKLFKSKKILVYNRMVDCEKFIEQQKKYCKETP
ncbi:MAG: hypothetical protein V1775_15900 [Bacteroidota bacterium]